MGVLAWTKNDEVSLNRLLKAKKLLDLATKSGYLMDRVEPNPKACVKAATYLLTLAVVEHSKAKSLHKILER